MPPGQQWSDGHAEKLPKKMDEQDSDEDGGVWNGVEQCLGVDDISKNTLQRKVETRGGTFAVVELQGIKEIGKGSFGTITKARARRGGRMTEIVAVKRPDATDCDIIERNVLTTLEHKNIVNLKYSFMERGLCNLVLELVDDGNLYDFLHAKGNYRKTDGIGIYLELFTYQLHRGLAYCHSHDIIHRDLKPENLLISKRLGTLKIADFGCACFLHESGKRVCYVGTRDFRSPELIMDARKYSSKVDIWAAGVILSELVLKKPVFYKEGTESSMEQLDCILQFLGPPTKEDCDAMHVKNKNWGHGGSRRRYFRDAFHYSPVPDLEVYLHLLERILTYKPKDRYTAWQCAAHRFYNILQLPTTTLPDGRSLPPLFDFSPAEISTMPNSVAIHFGYSPKSSVPDG